MAGSDQLLTIDEFARFMRRSPETVRRWWRKGALGSGAIKPGGRTSRILVDRPKAMAALRRAGMVGRG